MEIRESELSNFLQSMKEEKRITVGSKDHTFMRTVSQEARKITSVLNGKYCESDEIKRLFSLLIGHRVDDCFGLFPPFYTDFGKNIKIGKNVFINAGCHFQDQGGIRLGDNVLIGHGVVLATLNHEEDPKKRGDLIPRAIRIEKDVWVGSHSTILPGVTIGKGSIIAAGSVVTKDVGEYVVVAGVPAKQIRKIKRESQDE